MSYQIEDVNGCTKKIIFNFETFDLTHEIKEALVKKQKNVSLKGFRKGKAPFSMVEKMYRPQVESEALNSFIQKQLYDAVQKENLRVVGYPRFEDMNYDKGTSIRFNAVVEIFPNVKLKDIAHLTFEKDKVEFNDEELEKVRKDYLSSKAEMIEVENKEHSLENGQFAVMDFEGERSNGDRPDNMKGKEFVLEIGSGQFIPGFEEKMLGMKAGEERTIEVTFPENYQSEELQNEDVKFHITLLEIKEKRYPDFNDELAKEFGFESVLDFDEKNKTRILEQKEKQAKQKLNQNILEKIVSENEFDIPLALIAEQEEHLKIDMRERLSQQGFNEDMMAEYFEKWKDDFREKALFQVRSGLILDYFAKEHDVETNQDDYEKKLEEIGGSSGVVMDQIKEFYNKDEKMKNNLMYAIREEKTFEKIYDLITVS